MTTTPIGMHRSPEPFDRLRGPIEKSAARLLAQAQRILERAGVRSPGQDARTMLEEVTGCSRLELLMNAGETLTDAHVHLKSFREYIGLHSDFRLKPSALKFRIKEIGMIRKSVTVRDSGTGKPVTKSYWLLEE